MWLGRVSKSIVELLFINGWVKPGLEMPGNMGPPPD
jgi:hypothetical protein